MCSGHLYVFFGEKSVWSFAHFINKIRLIFFFLLLSYKSSSHILNIKLYLIQGLQMFSPITQVTFSDAFDFLAGQKCFNLL